jgi:transmembrane sensor
MNQKETDHILDKYLNHSANEKERALVESWYETESGKRKLNDEDDFEHLSTELWAATQQRAGLYPKIKTKKLWPYVAAAALILIFLSIGSYVLLNKQSGQQQLAKNQTHDIPPGSNKAILTLANGKKIILNNVQNGKLIQQENIAITKTKDGQIVYQASDKGAATDMAYNTTTTPRGGEYRITLTDGTNVWLNAASSITYPTTFSGKDRLVEITGEVYFEVAHNAAKPFRVKCHGQTVEVLGTHFDINSYDDENVVKTTLLEGSVKVSTGEHVALLRPGQQSQVSIKENMNGLFKGIQNVNADEAVAWKNGLFHFENADVQTVMRLFARWYDVDIIYKGKISERTYSGEIHKNLTVLQALDLLNFANIHFSVEGRKIVVSP